MITRTVAILAWFVHLFDPPPLDSMSRAQKIGRVFLVTISLTVICVLAAMLGAVGIFVMERGREMLDNVPELLGGLEIIFVGILVNAICVVVLLQIRKADRKLIPSVQS